MHEEEQKVKVHTLVIEVPKEGFNPENFLANNTAEKILVHAFNNEGVDDGVSCLNPVLEDFIQCGSSDRFFVCYFKWDTLLNPGNNGYFENPQKCNGVFLVSFDDFGGENYKVTLSCLSFFAEFHFREIADSFFKESSRLNSVDHDYNSVYKFVRKPNEPDTFRIQICLAYFPKNNPDRILRFHLLRECSWTVKLASSKETKIGKEEIYYAHLNYCV